MDKAKLAKANREGRTHTSFVAICRQEGKGLQGRVKSKQRFSFCYLSRRAYGTISLRDAASLVEASPVKREKMTKESEKIVFHTLSFSLVKPSSLD